MQQPARAVGFSRGRGDVPFFVSLQGEVCFFGKKRKYCLEAGRHVLLSFACPKDIMEAPVLLKKSWIGYHMMI